IGSAWVGSSPLLGTIRPSYSFPSNPANLHAMRRVRGLPGSVSSHAQCFVYLGKPARVKKSDCLNFHRGIADGKSDAGYNPMEEWRFPKSAEEPIPLAFDRRPLRSHC